MDRQELSFSRVPVTTVEFYCVSIVGEYWASATIRRTDTGWSVRSTLAGRKAHPEMTGPDGIDADGFRNLRDAELWCWGFVNAD